MKQTELAAYDGDGSNGDDSHETVTDGGRDTNEQSCPGPHHHEDDMCRKCRAESTVEFNDGAVNRGIDTSANSENVCMDCGASYPHGETCDCGGIDVL